MAKALVNKGVPIKADNPKDPYIMDASGINDIVNANTTFGKALKVSDQKIQLKNGNRVLSEVTVPATKLYTVDSIEVDEYYKPIYPGVETTITIWGMPLYTGTCYKLTVENGDLYASGTIEALEYNDNSITFSIDCSGINEVINEGSYLYLYVDSVDGNHYECTGYKDVPSTRTDYESVKVGDGLEIANNAISVDVGDGLEIANNAISVNVGDGLAIENGVLNAVAELPEKNPAQNNKFLALKYVNGVLGYHLDSVADVYTGEASDINSDITWNIGELSQNDIIEAAKNFQTNSNNHKLVAISIYSENDGQNFTLYPTSYNYGDTVVFSSTEYGKDPSNNDVVYLYSVKIVKNGPAAQLKRVTLANL